MRINVQQDLHDHENIRKNIVIVTQKKIQIHLIEKIKREYVCYCSSPLI